MTQVLASTESSTGRKVSGLSRADRWQPLFLVGAIVAGLLLAKAAPGFAGSLGPLVSVAVTALIYFAMLGVDIGQLAAVRHQRRFLTLAVGINFVLNPLLAWTLGALFLSGQPDLRVGLILFLVTPCIGWYLIFIELADGDVGLGVGLLGINVVLQVLLLPVYVYAFAGERAGIDLGDVAASVLLFLVAPAFAAWMTKRAVGHTPKALDDMQAAIGRWQLKTLALVVVIVAMFASQADALLDNPEAALRLAPPMVGFFAAAFVIAVGAASLAGLPASQTAVLVFTTASRNSEASLAIAATAFSSPLVALTVVIGPVVELPLLIVMAHALRR